MTTKREAELQARVDELERALDEIRWIIWKQPGMTKPEIRTAVAVVLTRVRPRNPE